MTTIIKPGENIPFQKLNAEWVKRIHDVVIRRLRVAYLSVAPDAEDADEIDIHPGVIEIVAEEVIKNLPELVLLQWSSGILTPDDVRKKRRKRS